MEMQASRTLAVSQQIAWEALNDPEVLKLCIPGCEKVEPTAENQYAVAMALKIGPVSAKFAGKITLADIVPPESYVLAFDGSGGVAGFGKGSAQVRLEPTGPGSCELHYMVKATVGGKIAQLGQRLIDGAARSMAEDFFKRFDNEMQCRRPQPQTLPADPLEDQRGAGTGPGAGPGSSVVSGPAQSVAVGASGAEAAGSIPVWVWAAGAAALVLVAWWVNG
jgi:carbon monoxide dehydrogenase subunit G